MNPLLTDTKWNELRLAMYDLGPCPPSFRVRNLGSGYVSDWDSEWYYHFRVGGYRSIEWVEIKVRSPEQREAVLSALRAVRVPGHEIEDGFRVYGHASDGVALDYL